MDEAIKSYHDLSIDEMSAVASINMDALQAKARLFDLQQQVEKANADLNKAQHQFNGVVAALGIVHGITNPGVSGDMKRIIRRS